MLRSQASANYLDFACTRVYPVGRFFETEAVAILTMIVSRYHVEVKEEPQFAQETFEQKKDRILKSKPGITMTYVLFVASSWRPMLTRPPKARLEHP